MLAIAKCLALKLLTRIMYVKIISDKHEKRKLNFPCELFSRKKN